MDNTDIKKFIILELGKHRKPNDIIIEVCEKTGMGWNDAQKFVRQVYTENHSEIVGHQNGIIFALVILEIIAGVAISLGILAMTLSGWIIFFLRFPVPYLGNLAYFMLGVFMILGGIKGYTNMKTPKK